MTGLSTRVTMIVDLVGSRRHADRVWVHRAFTDALAAVNRSATRRRRATRPSSRP
jgi:hypothetical protein